MKLQKQFILTAVAAVLMVCAGNVKLNAQETKEEPIDTLARSVAKLADDVSFLKKIKFSAYIQSQFQWADSMGAKTYEGKDFAATTDKRFTVRRAEFKTMYDNGKVQVVANINVSQDGVTIKDAYGKFTEQKLKMFSLTAGIFNRPFGFECPYSSGILETPDRSRGIQILFPGERDLGAMITWQMPAGSALHPLKLEAGLFNGTGNSANDFDYFKDFIGNLHWNANTKNEKVKYGIGASFYYGGVRQGTSKVYSMEADSAGLSAFKMAKDSAYNGQIARRQYFGVDAQISIDFPFGITTLRAEYIMGQQPGLSSTSTSPSAQPVGDTYIREFNTANFYFVQNIVKSKHAIVVKYDWYDPNTKTGNDNIGAKTHNIPGNPVIQFAKTGSSDIKYTTLGLGYIYKWDEHVKFTLYYDMVTNETSVNLGSSGLWKDVKDNVVTLRCQYKF